MTAAEAEKHQQHRQTRDHEEEEVEDEEQHEQEEGLRQRPRRQRRTVSLRVFVASLLCFCALALALGLGLGLGWPRYRTVDDASSPSRYPNHPFNASDYYGLPKDLEVIPIERLINATELELRTGFAVGKGDSADGNDDGSNSRGRKIRGGPAMRQEPMVREYVFDVTQAYGAPDGFRKPMMLVNGQSPGPLVEANTGDRVRVHVNNRMAAWSTTIHWHGIDQRGSTWMDGVTGVSQCGIPPGQSFTYEFTVDGQRGTFWWHAHLSVQYTDGVYGPLVRSLSFPLSFTPSRSIFANVIASGNTRSRGDGARDG